MSTITLDPPALTARDPRIVLADLDGTMQTLDDRRAALRDQLTHAPYADRPALREELGDLDRQLAQLADAREQLAVEAAQAGEVARQVANELADARALLDAARGWFTGPARTGIVDLRDTPSYYSALRRDVRTGALALALLGKEVDRARALLRDAGDPTADVPIVIHL